MDSLNFLNLIYFIRDLVQSLFYSGVKTPEDSFDMNVDEIKLTSIGDAIDYYSTDSKDLYNSIVSFDISLLGIQTANKSIKEHCVQLRTLTRALQNKTSLNTYVDISTSEVLLKEYLLNGSEGDMASSLESFFIASRKFLKLYEKVGLHEVNHRLLSGFAANLIYIKEVFAGIQYGGHDN